MKKINPIITTFIVISLIIVFYYLFTNKNLTNQQAEQEQKDKILLEQILNATNKENFSIAKCDEFLTTKIKQQCYKSFLARKIAKNEFFNKDFCYKLVEGGDKEVCLLWTEKR